MPVSRMWKTSQDPSRSEAAPNHSQRAVPVSLSVLYCGQGFSATNNLKGHLVKHTGIKSFVCHICKEEFSYGTILKAPVKRCHGGGVP